MIIIMIIINLLFCMFDISVAMALEACYTIDVTFAVFTTTTTTKNEKNS